MLVKLGSPRTAVLLDGEATGKDALGNDTRSWPETSVPGCAWWPSSTSEAESVGGDVSSSRFGLLMPDGTLHVSGRKPSPVDRVRLDDDTLWQIDGEPRQHVSQITSARGGIYAWLVRVTG